MKCPLFILLLCVSPLVGEEEPVRAIGERGHDQLKRFTGTWVTTSLQCFGQELIDPPGTSNLMKFDGEDFTELTPSGKAFLRDTIKVVGAKKGQTHIELPHRSRDLSIRG